ncbi:hypothetical protein ACVGOW_11660 [Pseudonocardia saturnea]
MLVTVAALGAGLLPGGTPVTGWNWAAVCAAGWVVIGVVGLAHLARTVVRDVPPQRPVRED